MPIEKLLVAVDNSDGSRKAADLAVELATLNPAAHVDVAYVVNVPLLSDLQAVYAKDLLDATMEDGKRLLQGFVDNMGAIAERTDTLLLTCTNTSPANELIELIGKRDYDLVVIGNRGLSGMREYMGSVSHKVLHGSVAPVLIAK